MSLRVAILTHSTNPRGGVSHALSIADALTDLGHEAVVHAPDPSLRGFFRAARCGTVSVPAAALHSAGTGAMVEQRIVEYAKYFAYSNHRGFDVYHAHDGIGGNVLADLAAGGLIPGFVRTVHHLDAFADPRLAARQRRGVSAASRLLCVSDVWRDTLRRDFGIDAVRVDNGVDLDEFSALPNHRDAEVRDHWGLGAGPIFLSVGGLEARKNSLRIIEAFETIRTSLPSAQLLIVGGASVLDHAAYAGRCTAAMAALGLAEGPGCPVVRTGPVAQTDMPALYRIADALVFPSLNEGFGLAVIEAMACGTPAVVSRIAPFTEYLGDEDALWADPADTASIADAMRRSLDAAQDPARGRRGLNIASRFDWRSSARAHLDVYRELVRAADPRCAEPTDA